MNFNFNHPIMHLVGGIFAILAIASVARVAYSKSTHAKSNPTFHNNLRHRINSWWVMIGIFLIACCLGRLGPVLLFAGISFLGLREFISQLNTKREDHGSLTWCFFVILPIQYLLIAFEKLEWFYLFIPLGGLAIIIVRNLLAGKASGFLSRTSQIYLAMIICVYSLGFVPAITQTAGGFSSGIGLLLFFITCIQANDVFQYITGNLFGKRSLSPNISPNKTIEGAIGGVLVTGLLGVVIHSVTPFTPLAASAVAIGVACLGIGGDLLLSAIKRDLKVKDFSELIPGHGGVLDRVDSLVLAAPGFYFATKLLLR